MNFIMSCYLGIGVIYVAWTFLKKRSEDFKMEVKTKWDEIVSGLKSIPENLKIVSSFILSVVVTAYIAWMILIWPVSIIKKVIKKCHP